VRRVQVVTAACAALMWTTAAGVPMAAAQGAGSGGAQTGSQAGSSSGPTAGTSGIGDQSGASGQAGTATTTGTQEAGNSNELQQFVEKAAVANMAEIQLGQLALKQAQDPQVKQFAQMMVDDHTKALEQLRTAVSSQGLQVATALDNKHQKLHDKLAKLQGAEFDREYMDAMVDTHKDTEKLLKRRAGKSASGSEMTSNQSTAGAAGTSSGTARDAADARSNDSDDQSGTSATGTTGSSGSTSATAGTSGSTTGSTETGTPSVGTPGTTSGATGTSGASSSGMSGSSAMGSGGSMSAPKSADEWAAMTLPKVRAHLEQARSLEDQVKESGRSNSGGDNPSGAGSTGSGSGSGTPGSGSTPPRQ
jgi:putative membrane protein